MIAFLSTEALCSASFLWAFFLAFLPSLGVAGFVSAAVVVADSNSAFLGVSVDFFGVAIAFEGVFFGEAIAFEGVSDFLGVATDTLLFGVGLFDFFGVATVVSDFLGVGIVTCFFGVSFFFEGVSDFLGVCLV